MGQTDSGLLSAVPLPLRRRGHSMKEAHSAADSRLMLTRYPILPVALLLALVAVSCGAPGPSASNASTTSSPPAAPTTVAPATTTPVTTITTTTVAGPLATFREAWLIETNRGEITARGEHTADADRWVEIYGSDSGSANREVIVVGDEAWERYAGDEWRPIDQEGIVSDLLNGHPFQVADVLNGFELVGPNTHEGRDVVTYAAAGPLLAGFAGIDTATVVEASAEVALFVDDTFAAYELYFERQDGEWARLTYRTYDFGAPITIERPEVVPDVVTCRDPGKQLIDEVGAYRSRYQLLHPGTVFSSIDELRLLDPWAWQMTVSFVNGAPPLETLWVDGGAQYHRTTGEPWQADTDGEYQSLSYRPFIDDLRVRDLVDRFSPVGKAEVAGRMVDIFVLDIDDIRLLNDSFVRNTDSLQATFWIEPCSFPEIMKLELIATGRGYAEGEFHIVYELYDLGTTDTIDIPPEALDD